MLQFIYLQQAFGLQNTSKHVPLFVTYCMPVCLRSSTKSVYSEKNSHAQKQENATNSLFFTHILTVPFSYLLYHDPTWHSCQTAKRSPSKHDWSSTNCATDFAFEICDQSSRHTPKSTGEPGLYPWHAMDFM